CARPRPSCSDFRAEPLRRDTRGRRACDSFTVTGAGRNEWVVLEEGACEIGGVVIRYRVAGSGHPAVLVHGLGGSWRWWKPVVEPLAERMRIYLVDLPGFGSARGRPFVLGDAHAYMRALLEEVGLERVSLIGHSLGGVVCARLAALWPDLVESLVLVAPAGLLDRQRPSQYALPIAAALRHARPR